MPQVFPSIYTATKIASNALERAYHHSYGVPISRVRAFNAFGPGQAWGPGHPQKIIPHFSKCAWAGIPIPIWGDGEQRVDLVHTDDLARMLVDATDYGEDETFDGGTGVSWTVNEVAEMVLNITKSKAGIEYLDMRRGELPTNIRAFGDGWDMLGWKPVFRTTDLVNAVISYR
jgi:UDP-glucose 4-epimerase